MKLEKDKWYLTDWSTGTKAFIRATGDGYYYSEVIDDKNIHKYKSDYVGGGFPIREAKISEFSQYLPQNHPDLNILLNLEIW